METSQSAGNLAEILQAKAKQKRLQSTDLVMTEEEEKEKSTENDDDARPKYRSRRPFTRSYTDPTDLLWVFRSRGELPSSEGDSVQFGGLTRKTEDHEGERENPVSAADESIQERKPSTEGEKSVRHSSASSESSEEGRSTGSRTTADLMEAHSTHEHIEKSTKELYLNMALEENLRRRKISAPAFRPGRRPSLAGIPPVASRRNSIVSIPPRRARRGSEAPSLTSLARKRASQAPSYPVGLKRRTSKGFLNADLHLNIRAKAKHEMLANLVLPAFVEHVPRPRERRNTITVSGRTKKDEKRYQIAKEILQTEKKYLACLKTLNTVFEEPMREGNYIPQKYIDMVFPGELVQIRESHTLFMKDLEERLCSPSHQFDIVGDIFTKLSSSYHINVLRIYSDYVNNFPKAIAVINKCSRGSQKFRKFLESCSTSPECDGLDISAFLLTPIQRLPRYVLLLRQLSKYTDAGHPDSFHIENALEIMKQMINVLNDSIQSSCKLANNGSRKSVKSRKLSIKKREIQKLRKESRENDLSTTRSVESSPSSALAETSVRSNESADQSSTSFTSSTSPRPLSRPTLEKRNSYSSDSSSLRVTSKEKTSRPVSTGDLDKLYDKDNQGDFDVIEEENDCNEAKDKSSGASKIKAAAGNMIRNLQRRSKRWRRSFDIEHALATEQRKISDEQSAEKTETDRTSLSKNDEAERTESALSDLNPNTEQKDIKELKDTCSSTSDDFKIASTIEQRGQVKPRPMSSLLPAGYKPAESNLNELKTRVFSDNNLSKEQLRDSASIWVPRQRPIPRRRVSDVPSSVASSSRHSSVASYSDTSQLFDSRKSLLRNSQESLTDSGVSETPHGSPINTLTRSNTAPCRKARSLCNVETSVDAPGKPFRPDRRSLVGGKLLEEPASTEVENNNNQPKNKRKLKKVMKDFFLGRRRNSGSHQITVKENLSNPDSKTIDEKMSTV